LRLSLIGRAIELGVTMIDTADIYTGSEVFTGKAIAGRRDKVVLATKLGIVRALVGGEPPVLNGRPEYVRERIERSLTRLGTDHVDGTTSTALTPTSPSRKPSGPGALSYPACAGVIAGRKRSR
jgi:aryl-alcohol dehydrogenase-like predicted oxidoreductase